MADHDKNRWSTQASAKLDEDRSTKPQQEVFTARGLHPSLNPHGVRVRESRASEKSPHPRQLIFGIDGTGSHRDWPMRMTTGVLTTLMALLHDHGFLTDPQVLISMIRDCKDNVPLEVAQFEIDEKIRMHLENCYVAAGGGAGVANYCEDYGLLVWWAATHTSCDGYEKDGRKGYLVICGDEMSNPTLDPATVQRVTGETLETALPFESVLAMAQQQWEVIFFFSHTDHYDRRTQEQVFAWWQARLGERAIHLYSPDDVAVQTAIVTGLLDGSVASLEEGIARAAAAGTPSATIDRVRRALAAFAASIGKAGTVEGVEPDPNTRRRASRV